MHPKTGSKITKKWFWIFHTCLSGLWFCGLDARTRSMDMGIRVLYCTFAIWDNFQAVYSPQRPATGWESVRNVEDLYWMHPVSCVGCKNHTYIPEQCSTVMEAASGYPRCPQGQWQSWRGKKFLQELPTAEPVWGGHLAGWWWPGSHFSWKNCFTNISSSLVVSLFGISI